MKTITYNPETHKLVPIEPTDEMLKTLTITASLEASWASAYKAMLNAAPAAEADECQECGGNGAGGAHEDDCSRAIEAVHNIKGNT